MIRFEILLPLFHNDGRPVEPEKFVQTGVGKVLARQDRSAGRRLATAGADRSVLLWDASPAPLVHPDPVGLAATRRGSIHPT